jgi:multidrug resistance protein
VFLDLLGFSFVIPLYPEYKVHFRMTGLQVTLLSTCYSLAQFIFAPILGRLSDRVGRKPVLLYSLIGSSIAFYLFGAAQSVWLLFVSRIADGISGGNIATAQAYIADVTTKENRARGMGIIGAAFGMGFILGPAIGGLLGRYGLGVPAFAACGLAAVNSLLVALVLPESRTLPTATPATGKRTSSVGRLLAGLRHPVLGNVLTVVLLNMIAFAALENTIGLLTKDRFGFDQTHNGYLFAGIGVTMAIIQGGLIGRLVKRHGEARLVLAGVVMTGLGLLLIPLAPTVPLLLLAGLPMALGNGIYTPSVNSLVSKAAHDDEQGATLGLSQGLSSLGRILGPVAGGLLYDRYGPGAPLLGGAALMVVCLIFALRAFQQHREPAPVPA